MYSPGRLAILVGVSLLTACAQLAKNSEMPHPQSTIQKGSDKNRSEPHRAQADLSADPISQPVLTSTTTALAPVFEQGIVSAV